MKTNKHFLLGALLLALLSACEKERLAPAADGSIAVEERSPTVPFRASYRTQPTVVGFNAGIITLAIPAQGKGTHLGKSTWYADSWVDTNVFPFLQTGEMTFTAANGAQLFGTFSGAALPGATPDAVTFSGAYTITGGSGRFAGTTGSGTYSGSAVGTNGELFFEGVLENP